MQVLAAAMGRGQHIANKEVERADVFEKTETAAQPQPSFHGAVAAKCVTGFAYPREHHRALTRLILCIRHPHIAALKTTLSNAAGTR